MTLNRLEQLLKFLEEDPDDPFTLYAIAIEYQKTDNGKAHEFFSKLLQDHPGYVPTYYHAGKLFEKQGNKEQAESIYRKGMEESQKAKNNHAFRELQGALNALLYNYNDDD